MAFKKIGGEKIVGPPQKVGVVNRAIASPRPAQASPLENSDRFSKSISRQAPVRGLSRGFAPLQPMSLNQGYGHA
jgi:hypothetical protein